MTTIALALVLVCVGTGLQMVRTQYCFFEKYREIHGGSLILEDRYVASPWLWFAHAVPLTKKAIRVSFRPQADADLERRRLTYLFSRRLFVSSMVLLLLLSVAAVVVPR